MKRNIEYLKRQDAIKQYQLDITRSVSWQMVVDSAMIAAHEIFGMGPGRAQKFYDSLYATLLEIATITDQDNDEMWETKTKVDRKLKTVVGDDKFTPWEERYDFGQSNMPKMIKKK